MPSGIGRSHLWLLMFADEHRGLETVFAAILRKRATSSAVSQSSASGHDNNSLKLYSTLCDDGCGSLKDGCGTLLLQDTNELV